MKLCKLLTSVVLASVLLPSAALHAETVRWARSSDPATLDPHAVNLNTNVTFLHQVYEPLVLRTADGKLQPALATSWQVTRDPTVWEFKLRPGVRFHDGAPFGADDVVFSIQRAKAPTSAWKTLLAPVVEVRKVDALTVQLKTSGPNLVLPHTLTNLFIVNAAWSRAHQAEQPQDVSGKDENFATRNENGTGAYQLVSREQDTRTVFRQFPGYWGKGQFPLEVTQIVFQPIKTAATRVAALLSGEVDFVQDVPAQDVARLKADARLRVTEGLENRTIYLGLNVGAGELKYSDVKGRNPLADARVREAFRLAIDRDTLRTAVMRGLSVPAGIITPQFVHGYEKAFDTWPKPDAARARQLLAEAGYPGGFGITLHCPNNRYVNDETICTAVAGFLARIGVRVSVAARPIAQHATAINQADTDFYLYGWAAPTFDSAYIFDYLVHTRGKDGRGSANAIGYSNPDIDAKIASLAAERDPAKRDATIHAIWQTVQQEGFYIALHHQVLDYAMQRKLDIPVSPEDAILFKNVKVGDPAAAR
ncbi:ABC transporter substrate-binding protein [Variovorax sp. LjRoot84]|uniref:ABC transporter substrate-binding protein n=1 Tax=Variovorax sp. LjRoot84 TaxID=3342340 RepID=UPI003ED14CA4